MNRPALPYLVSYILSQMYTWPGERVDRLIRSTVLIFIGNALMHTELLE